MNPKKLFSIGVTKETSPLVQTLLFKKGYRWSQSFDNISHTSSPSLTVWNDGYITYATQSDHDIEIRISTDEFLNLLATDELPARITPLMIGYYEARVQDDGSLKVGCQTITLKQARAALAAMEAKAAKAEEKAAAGVR